MPNLKRRQNNYFAISSHKQASTFNERKWSMKNFTMNLQIGTELPHSLHPNRIALWLKTEKGIYIYMYIYIYTHIYIYIYRLLQDSELRLKYKCLTTRLTNGLLTTLQKWRSRFVYNGILLIKNIAFGDPHNIVCNRVKRLEQNRKLAIRANLS